MKVQNITDVEGFFKVVDSCKGRVELVTGEGDRLNLKSKLSQYVSMANIFSNGEIPEQMDKDAELILECIETCGGKLPFTDKADPERIKAEMGMSKAAFKRAVGRLLKQKKIVIKEDGIYSL